MNRRFEPGGRLRGTVRAPADKSLSHRAALLGAMCADPVRVTGYLDAADTRSTLDISSTGAKFAASWSLPPGTPVRISVLGGVGDAYGDIIRLRPVEKRRDEKRRYEMAVRLKTEANVWSVKKPPADWDV